MPILFPKPADPPERRHIANPQRKVTVSCGQSSLTCRISIFAGLACCLTCIGRPPVRSKWRHPGPSVLRQTFEQPDDSPSRVTRRLSTKPSNQPWPKRPTHKSTSLTNIPNPYSPKIRIRLPITQHTLQLLLPPSLPTAATPHPRLPTPTLPLPIPHHPFRRRRLPHTMRREGRCKWCQKGKDERDPHYR